MSRRLVEFAVEDPNALRRQRQIVSHRTTEVGSSKDDAAYPASDRQPRQACERCAAAFVALAQAPLRR